MHYRERDLYAVWQPHLCAQFDAGVPGNAKQAAGPSQEGGEANLATCECVLLLRGGTTTPYALCALGCRQLVRTIKQYA